MSTYRKSWMFVILMILLATAVSGASLDNYKLALGSPLKSLGNGIILFLVVLVIYQIVFRSVNTGSKTLSESLFYILAGIICLFLGFSTKGQWIWSYLFTKDSWSILTWIFMYDDGFTIKPLVNILFSWLVVYVLLKIVPGLKNIAENEKGLRVIICLIIAVLFAYSTADVRVDSQGTYKSYSDVFIWSTENGSGIISYLFGVQGLLRGQSFFVFIGSLFLLYMVGKSLYPDAFQNEKLPSWIIIIMLSSSISKAELGLAVFMKIAFWTLLILFYKSLNNGMKNPGLASAFSFAVLNTVATNAFPQYFSNYYLFDSFIANFIMGYIFGAVFLTGFFNKETLFDRIRAGTGKWFSVRAPVKWILSLFKPEEFEAVSENFVAKSKVFEKFLEENYAKEVRLHKDRENFRTQILLAANTNDMNRLNKIRSQIESNFRDEVELKNEFDKTEKVSVISKDEEKIRADAETLRKLMSRITNDQRTT